MRTLDQLVQQEVIYCVSSLITALAAAEHSISLNTDNAAPLRIACTDAMDLSCPVPDYEEAATQAGWVKGSLWVIHDGREENFTAETAKEACNLDDLDPHDYAREVYEHWIVTDWLADKLAAKGEAVSKDIAGLTVWGRTTTGQAVSMDHVIQEIYADLMKPEATA